MAFFFTDVAGLVMFQYEKITPRLQFLFSMR
jgi:hypothetical protein